MEIPCKISLDHNNANTRILNLEEYKLLIEVIDPLKESTFLLKQDTEESEVVFAAELPENQVLYFRVLHHDYMTKEKPWTLNLFLGMAEYYLKTQLQVEPDGFEIINEMAIYTYDKSSGEVSFDEAV